MILYLIKSWSHQGTADIWDGTNSKAAREIPRTIWQAVGDRLDAIHAAHELRDLALPPSNRLHPLKGRDKGRYSLRINQQYRITFRWDAGHAWEVRCEDYH